MTSLLALSNDLREEHESLARVLAAIDQDQWRVATASPGWDVADQIAHLTYFDEAATRAICEPSRFRVERDELFARALAGELDEFTLGALRALEPPALHERWRQGASQLDRAAQSLDETSRLEWFGPSMGAKSFLSARLMETWAHGTDVVDAVGVERPASDRLIHVARLGYNTRRWSYQVRGETMLEGDVRLELVGPNGATWTWGPETAEDVVRGPAEEFCLVVTQRRHLADTSLVAGELGTHWLQRAQAFAGAPTSGPARRVP